MILEGFSLSPLKRLNLNFVEKHISKTNSNSEIESFHLKMSTTRSQKRRNNQKEITENVSEGLVSPIALENGCQLDQDACIASPSRAKSPMVENSFLESLRAFLKEEITSEIRNLLVESQKEMLRLLKPRTGENMRENNNEEPENETRSFTTPTKSVRINSTQNDDPTVGRNKGCPNDAFVFNTTRLSSC